MSPNKPDKKRGKSLINPNIPMEGFTVFVFGSKQNCEQIHRSEIDTMEDYLKRDLGLSNEEGGVSEL